MIITEEEKKDILLKYKDNTSDELLKHLKRSCPVFEYKLDSFEEPIKLVLIDDKTYTIKGNKKYLVNKLFDILEGDWVHLKTPILRRTIKKYIDGISN